MRRILVWLLFAVLSAGCGISVSTESGPGSETSAVSDSTQPFDPEGADQTPNSTAASSSSQATTPTQTTEPPVASEPQEETTTSTQVQDEKDQGAVGADPGEEPPPIAGLDAPTAAQVWKTLALVEEVRGLEFDGVPFITVLAPEEFAARIGSEIESQMEDVEVDEALYKLLGLLAAEDDLAALYEELYTQSVAGFYSSDTKEMVLPQSEEGFSGLETLTLFHELVHAVTDQHFGFGAAVDALVEAYRFDQANSLVALVEGDATVAEVLYVQQLSSEELDRLFQEFGEMEEPDLNVPLFMQKALFFPYEEGFEYVLEVWEEGDWQAVNGLYQDPPRSTEEIYEGPFSGSQPIEMARPAGRLPDGYQETYDYTWGLLDILLMFEQILGADVARDAAVGWGGGRSLVGYHPGGEVVFIWEYVGDTPEESEELARLLYDYAASAMAVGTPSRDGGGGFAASDEDYVYVSLLPDKLVMVACSDPVVCPAVTDSYPG